MVSHAYKMTGTYCRPLSQRLADWQTQVVIHAAFDQGDDVDSFENIVDKAWKGSANVLATDGVFRTFGVQDGHARYTPFDQDVDDFNDGRVHGRRCEVVVGPQQELPEWLPQFLSIPHIDGDKFQNAVLGDDAQEVRPVRLTVIGDKGNSASSGFEHTSAGIVKRSFGVNRDCLRGRHAESLFHLCKSISSSSRWTILFDTPRRLSRRNWSIRSKAAGFWK